MDVSIVIVNYNTYQLTTNCIRSVYQFTKDLMFEIILVDNASKDFPVDDFQQEFPKVKLITSAVNLGFAGGNNLGIKDATGKYILLLNSDTYLKENSIHVAYTYMEHNKEVGVLSARLVYPDGKHQSVAQRFPSVKYQLIEILRIQKLLGKKKAGETLLGSFFDHKKTVSVDWVWGAFFFFRADILPQLSNGKLDDTYFMYNEDIQWCMDIRSLGYEIHFLADTEVVHIMEGSGGKKSKMMIENGEKLLSRNYSKTEAWAIKKLRALLNNN